MSSAVKTRFCKLGYCSGESVEYGVGIIVGVVIGLRVAVGIGINVCKPITVEATIVVIVAGGNNCAGTQALNVKIPIKMTKNCFVISPDL